MKKQMKKNKKGFTLVEMIVVIAIIGVLAAMMVPSLLGYIEKANTSNNRAAATNIARSAQAVLAELNDITIADTESEFAFHEDSTDGIALKSTAPAAGSSNEKFVTELIKMFDTNFKGKFVVQVEDGVLEVVNYCANWASSDAAMTITVTTDSNKTIGVYPES